jgi:hypothetical protein
MWPTQARLHLSALDRKTPPSPVKDGHSCSSPTSLFHSHLNYIVVVFELVKIKNNDNNNYTFPVQTIGVHLDHLEIDI